MAGCQFFELLALKTRTRRTVLPLLEHSITHETVSLPRN
jgi:hypothetical protein